MFLTLLTKEIRQHLLTFRFAAALLTTLILVIVSVWVLSEDFIRRRDTHNIMAERSAQADREVYVPTQINPTMHRPPSPLSIFAQGEDRRFGTSVNIHRWEVPREAAGRLEDNELLIAESPLDLLTIFTLVVSLFGILLSYDQISGERETGTLRLMCTGAVSRGKMYTAKFFSGVFCLAIPFLLSFIAGLLVITFVFDISFTPTQWPAIAIMVLAGLVFAALFIAIGLACSALLRNSAAALVLSLLIWALGVMVIPTAAQSIADYFVPLPSAAEITDLATITQREIDDKEINEFRPKHPDYGSGSTAGWPDEYWLYDGTPANFSDTEEYVRFLEPLMLERAQKIWEASRKHKNLKERQAEIANIISAPAPAFQLRSAFTALAGTGTSNYRRFLDEARQNRRLMVADFQGKGYFGSNAWSFFSRRERSDVSDELFAMRSRERRLKRERGIPSEQISGPHLWGRLPESEIPHFEFTGREPDLMSALWPIGYLAIATFILFVLGFIAFIRYDVR